MSGALVIGYGSPIRGDDAVGWRVAEVLQDDPRLAAATVLARHQLTPELADDVAGADVVVLVDAVVDQAPGTVEVTQVVARVAAGASSHELDPGGLLALATRIHHRAPPAYVVRVGAACIEPGEELSVAVDAALPAIVEEVARLASTSGLIS